MRGEMRRSIRGAGTWPTDKESRRWLLRCRVWCGWLGMCRWPGGEHVTLPSPHVWVWAMMIRDIYIEEMWRRTVISLSARGLHTHYGTQGHWSWTHQIGSVRPLSDWFPMCCVCAGVYLLSILPSHHQGQRTLPSSIVTPELHYSIL